jgi:hypothetical protein
MQIIQCPHCAKRVGRTEGEAGQQAKCPHCQGVFMLPDLPPADPPTPHDDMIVKLLTELIRQQSRQISLLRTVAWHCFLASASLLVILLASVTGCDALLRIAN